MKTIVQKFENNIEEKIDMSLEEEKEKVKKKMKITFKNQDQDPEVSFDFKMWYLPARVGARNSAGGQPCPIQPARGLPANQSSNLQAIRKPSFHNWRMPDHPKGIDYITHTTLRHWQGKT